MKNFFIDKKIRIVLSASASVKATKKKEKKRKDRGIARSMA